MTATDHEPFSGQWSWGDYDMLGRQTMLLNGSEAADEYWLLSSANSPKFRITGDVTLHACGRRESGAGGTTQHIIMQAEGGETSADNYLYDLYWDGGTWKMFWEYGSGSNEDVVSSLTTSVGNWFLITARRDTAALTVDFFLTEWINGVPVYSEELGVSYTNNPTGGGSTELIIGTNSSAQNPWGGNLGDLRVYNTALPIDTCRQIHRQDTWLDLYQPDIPVVRKLFAPTTDYSMTLDPVTYSLSPQNVDLLVSRLLTMDPVTYSMGAQSMNLYPGVTYDSQGYFDVEIKDLVSDVYV